MKKTTILISAFSLIVTSNFGQNTFTGGSGDDIQNAAN
jgi:predicted small secreted protein